MGGDSVRPVQISDGSSDLQDPIEGPGGKSQFIDRPFKEVARFVISGAVPLDLAVTHLSIAVNTGAFKPLCLHGASSVDPVQDFH